MKKRIWKTVLIISMIGCVCCLGFVAWYLYQDYLAQKEYEKLQEQIALEEELKQQEEEKITLEEIENLEFTGEREGEEAKLPEDIFLDLENPIDFEELTAINTDIYAWIRIPNTKIDYPIAQRAGDDGFYLKHDMYQQPRIAGCIYTEDCNSKDFTDPNTVIYGHNMKNLTMFQNLHLFSDEEFFQENPYVYIYTPDHVLVYKIFAAYIYDDRHIMNSFDFSDPEVYAQYLEDIFSVRSMDKHLREDVEVTCEDKIITLATCIGGKTESRYLVQAVLVKDETNG
ncbi:MAG: class B sortase [Ruminococcus sp.]|nr:class B sortase [Ruminococcus sp.]